MQVDLPQCRHLLRRPGQDRCDRCQQWDRFLRSWFMLEEAVKLKPVLEQRALASECRRRFSTFVKEAFRIIRPGTPLVWTWYLEALCDHVQWVLENWRRAKRDRLPEVPDYQRNLLVSVPPGSGKTLVISVLAPAWMWIDSPEWSCLCLSVNPMVARDAAVDCRALVQSPWYRANFVTGVTTDGRGAEVDDTQRGSGLPRAHGVGPAKPDSFEDWADAIAKNPAGKDTEMWAVSEDRNTMGKFVTTRGGFRASQGMTAQVIGARADAVLIDDPNDPAASSDEFDRTNNKYDTVLYHRVNNLAVAVRIVIQQRLDPLDLTGFILVRYPDGSTHLRLPLLHEPDRTCRTPMPVNSNKSLWLEKDGTGPQVGMWVDPRTVAGQVLSPKRWPKKEVENLRAGANFGAICQQDPDRAEGEHFPEKLWGFWVPSTSLEIQRQAWKKMRPLGCDQEKDALVIPVSGDGRLGVARVWVTDDPTSGSTSSTASHLGLLVVAEMRHPKTDEQLWVVVHDCDPGPRSPAQQREDLDRAIYLAARMTGHDRVRVLVEDKSSGKDHAEDIEKHVNASSYENIAVSVELYKAGTDAKKEDRDVAVLDYPHTKGQLLLPDGALWLKGLVKQFRRFPRKPNDKVDALGQFVAHTKVATKGWGQVFLRAVQ